MVRIHVKVSAEIQFQLDDHFVFGDHLYGRLCAPLASHTLVCATGACTEALLVYAHLPRLDTKAPSVPWPA